MKPNLENNLKKWDHIERYSQWIYNTYRDYVGKRILDIGVGVGNMTQFFVEQAELVLAADLFDSQLDLVQERFSGYPVKTMLLNIETDEVELLKEYGLDTVVCINVLEHIEKDLQALLNMKELLVQGGHIIIFVPACSSLYNYMDKNAGHYRRYDKGQLQALAQSAKLRILKQGYFNMLGIVPYYLKHFSKKNKEQKGTFSCSLNDTNSKFYNIATAILEPIEQRIKIPIGLSEFIILEK